MKKLVSVSVAALFVAATAGSVWLAGCNREEPATSKTAYDAPSAPKAAQAMGDHRVDGTVSTVDHATGLIKLTAMDAEQGTLTVHFPPAQIADVGPGDKLSVEMAFYAPGVAPPQRAYDAPNGMKGAHRMSGAIASIDHGTGRLSLTTLEGTLELPFAPSSISSLKDGDRITVDLAYSKAP